MPSAFSPTWDLVIVIFFAIIMAYSFIVGRNATLKIILATYISILTTDGLGNIIRTLFMDENAPIRLISGADAGTVIVLKILMLVFGIVLLTIRGNFFVESPEEHSQLLNTAFGAGFGFLSAGLIVSTILVYVSGGAFIQEPGTVAVGIDIGRTSYLARTMMENYSVWFALPAIAFVFTTASGGGGGEAAHGE